ncbi:MAG: type II toxin-antitoxin system HicA family toxin [Xanthomonadales bacterium]|nr:type II toxin-antitoxin system HicA family toxin [Xanthomonadales bacterium]
MKLPRDVDADSLCKALGRLGYSIVRQSGSHIRLRCPIPEHAITVPNHRPIRVGTLAAILQELAAAHHMDRQQLLEKIFG